MRARQLSIRTILLLITGALTLLIVFLAGRALYVEWRHLEDIRALKGATALSDLLFNAEDKLGIERDVVYSLLHVPDADTTINLREQLSESRAAADKTLQAALDALAAYDLPGLAEQVRKTKEQMAALQELRRRIDKAAAVPLGQRDATLLQQGFTQSTEVILQTQRLWIEFIRHFSGIDPQVSLHMRFKHLLAVVMDYAGRERSLIGRLLAKNIDPTPAEQAQLLEWQGAVALGWESADNLADQSGINPAIAPYLKDARSHYSSVYDMVKDLFYMPGRTHGKAYPISVDLWLGLSTQTTDSLYALKDAAFAQSSRYMTALDAAARREILIDCLVLLFAFGLCLYSFWIIGFRVIRPINAMVAALMDTMEGRPARVEAMHSQRDEMGKLARVLHAFQRNTEEIKRTSAELARYTKALERSNKELDDFAYIASHDLKEPLRGIHNHSRFLLEDNQEKLDADSVSRLERLGYLSQRMERLVNDLLYFSRLGRQELAVGPADINAVIHDIEGTLELFLQERHGHILIPKPLPTVTCDKVRITEVFRNLITNAVKYNNKQERNVEIGFLDSATSPDGRSFRDVFYVKDDGKGIAPEFHEEIFRIFKRLQSNANSKEEGTGVGLTFVKKIIERHGGRIWLASEPGKGTTFYFILGGQYYDQKAAA